MDPPVIFFPTVISRGCDADILCVQVAGVYRTAAKDDNIEGVDVKAGQNIFANIFGANHDVSF